ncbi:DUF2312 domain-containing protein [Candidatus Megaera venefica]|uniref:DUF2312 domain-containing protein n=1 Tax=Candidatus Megaera venefica TaxID=2055910 RepID=A0ABU5NER0_9RICK|nr:GapR family DNA-binding domain-containing protein [Candidatus Megaera venefica]MEA0971635.1 DUF2312 domain-containing protein [Candidatus Megaera venefica]
MQEVVDSQDLLNTISKLEKLEEEKNELADVTKDAYNEAKSKGYDVKIIKHILKLRKKDKDALAEEDSLIELYRGAVGI